jgi:integrase
MPKIVVPVGSRQDHQMPKIKLTQVAVDRLQPPAEGRVEIWDTILPGFGLRIAAPRPGQAARRTWQVLYRVRGKSVRETLGTTATVPKVDAARALARASIQKAQQGINPVRERREIAAAEATGRGQTLAAAIDRYLERYAVKRMRAEYFAETKRTLDRDVKPALGSRSIGEITRGDIRELLERIVDRGSPSHANHCLAYLRAMLGWAVANDLITANPCAGLQMPSPKVERDRALDDGEIALFWRACDDLAWPFGPLFQLLLLTGQRRDEVAEAPWSEFDLDKGLWTLPRARTKNERAHLVHLSPAAAGILRELPRIGVKGLVFTTNGETPISGFSHAAARLKAVMLEHRRAELIEIGRHAEAEQATFAHFTLHDLRRSCASGMAGLGVAPHVVDKILNHSTGTISGVARIYNRHEYLVERQAALLLWSRHIEALANPSSNVVVLTAARG